ncbi:MAG TPA: POTRA domain-containing protein [Candidatus Acidoferrum sp.]|nr:POTRA domain-containing protein [Candidatus Acidoferrum sp.]
MKANWVNELRGTVIVALLAGIVPAPIYPQQVGKTEPSQIGEQTAMNAPLVAHVRIVTEEGRILSESPQGVKVEIGKPIDRDEVAASIHALYGTGDYADIRAVEESVAGGVRLDFVVRENLFFNQIQIEGLTPPPSDASAVAAMQIGLGEVYRSETLKEALTRLTSILEEEGLYQAQLRFETHAHPATHQMDVVVHVTPGPRAQVSAVRLTNSTEYRDGEILSRLKIKPGMEVTSARIQRGTERIRKFLVKKGHLSGRAAVRRGEYDAANHSIPLSLEVSAGPLVRVEVEGAKISKGDLRKLLPIYEEGAVDRDLLDEGKRNLQERMEREGYFDAKVSYETANREVQGEGAKEQESEEEITYKVKRGIRHKLVGIGITGNKYFNTELLKSRLQIYPAAFGSRGRFSRRMAEADRQSMENLYRSNGFLNAKVEAHIKDKYEQKEGDIYVRFVVQEGEQTRVASLTIDGNHSFSKSEIMNVTASSPGQPYSDFNVSSDRANILALYFNEGFPEASVLATAEPIEVPEAGEKGAGGVRQEVRLTYHIEEGPQSRVHRVLITGYVHTRPGIIRRQVTVKPDEPLRAGDVVDTQRRLYNLGIFNRVTVAPQNPNGSDPNKDVVVQVEEAKRYTVAYGGGFEVQRLASTTNPTGGEVQAAPRGILELSKLNLTGRADSLSLKLRGSTLQGRALLAYSAPNTFTNPHLSTQATAYFERTQDINTFSETRYEAGLQLTDQFSSRTTLLYRYSFRKILVSNLNIPAQEIPLFQQPTLVSQFGATWVRDTRDNPADASRGTLNTADFGVADTSIGSSASFLRFLYQNASYYPIKRRFSFARSIRIGILEPYKDTVSLSFPAETATPLLQLIPLPERFFAGGGTSLRGFALNQAGPRDSVTGFPVGGQALLVLNQEFRFPMRLPFIGSRLGGTLFYDGGNVYSRLSRMTFRWSSPKPVFDPTDSSKCLYNCTNELNYFSHTVGLGVRYATPVGPIRVDVGYQINRPYIVVPIPCPSFTPNCTPGSLGYRSTQLPRLQVFFNLGSTF